MSKSVCVGFLAEPDGHCVSDAVFRQHLVDWAVLRVQDDLRFLFCLRRIRIDRGDCCARLWKIQIESAGKHIRDRGREHIAVTHDGVTSFFEKLIIGIGNLEFAGIQPAALRHGDSHSLCLRHRDRAAHAQRAFLHREVIAAIRQIQRARVFRIIIGFSVCADRRDRAAFVRPGKGNGRCIAQTGFVRFNFIFYLRCTGGSIFIRDPNELPQRRVISILGIGPHIRFLAEIVCHRRDQSLPGLRGLRSFAFGEAEEGCLLCQRIFACLVAALKFARNAVDSIHVSILKAVERVSAGEQRLCDRLSGRVIHTLRRNDDAIRRRRHEVEEAV